MKRIGNLALLALPVLATCLFAACKKEPPPVNDPEKVNLDLTFVISDVGGSSATFDITPSDANTPYYWSFIPEDDYEELGSEDAIKNEDMAYFADEAEKASVSVDEIISQKLERGTIHKTLTGLSLNTTYIAYGYAMTNGVTSDISVARFTTLGEGASPARLEVEIKATRMTQADVVITPESASVLYFPFHMYDTTYQNYGGNDAGAIDFFKEMAAFYADDAGLSLLEYYEQMWVRGVYSNTYHYLDAESTIWFCAVELDAAGNILGVDCASTTTTEREMVDLSFDISVTEITQSTAKLKIVPSNNNQAYWWDLCPKEDYARGGGTDEGFMKSYVANYDAATIQRYLQKGSFEYNIGDELTILPGVEYMVVAFAFNETFISGLGRKDFRAQDMVAQNDFKVEMETIWLGSTRAHMLFTPNDTTKPYSYWYVEKSFIDGYSNMNEAVQAAYAKRLAEYMAAYPEFTDEFGVKHNTREQLMELMVRYGQRFYQSSSDMIPDTDYYMWAIGVNAKGEFLTPPSLQLYHTQPWVAGNATCEPVMPRYFDGAQILSGEYKDYYVGVLTEVNVTNSDAWYVTVFVGDRTSTDDLPDYRAASTMYNNVPNNPSTYRPRANSRVYVNKNTGATSLRTLMGVAIEKGGEEGATQEARFGPVSRQLFDFNAAGCADPSLFPSNTLGAKSEFAPYSYRPEKVGALIYDAPYGGAVSVTSASAVTGPVSRMALISRDADLDKNDMWRDVTREELRKNQAVRFSHRVR